MHISGHRLCSLFSYTSISALNLVSGSLSLVPGASVTLSGFSLTDAGADLGLYYPNGGFGDSSAMIDFVQW